MKIVHKGEYGYIAYQKKWTIIRTVIYFAICMSIFAIGIITTGSRRNLLTIVAILGCLPACKSAVNVIMFMRARGCSSAAYEVLSNLNAKYFCLYDLYMTSYKTNYAVSNLTIAEKTIICLSEDDKADLNGIEKHIEEHLKQDGYKDMTVKAYNDVQKYCDRILQLEAMDLKPLKVQDAIMEMLLAISL